MAELQPIIVFHGGHFGLEKQHGFVIIDLSSKKHNDKYRSWLDEFYIPNYTHKILVSHYKKMENLLKQIVDNTEPKRSFSIVVSDNKTRFKTWFKPPIQLDKKRLWNSTHQSEDVLLISKYR